MEDAILYELTKRVVNDLLSHRESGYRVETAELFGPDATVTGCLPGEYAIMPGQAGEKKGLSILSLPGNLRRVEGEIYPSLSGEAHNWEETCNLAENRRFPVCVSSIWREKPDGWEAVHLHLSVPAETEYYRKMAELDQMTGLYNRASFERYVDKKMTENGSGIFYMIDLDDFKQVNDSYGHPAGDRVIGEMADILKRAFLPSALIGRLGGDEFAVFEDGGISRKEAEEKARCVMEEYRALSAKYGEKVLLSCSVGLYRELCPSCFGKMYEKADQALYFSKNTYKGTFHWYYCRNDE